MRFHVPSLPLPHKTVSLRDAELLVTGQLGKSRGFQSLFGLSYGSAPADLRSGFLLLQSFRPRL